MKLSLSRIFETSKLLATDAGQQLQEFITYSADLAEQVLRALRNQLNFKDNFDCDTKVVSLMHGVDTIISLGTRIPFGVMTLRCESLTNNIDSLGWHIDASGNFKVNVRFTGVVSSPINTTLVIFFS